jgi:hypothetical protein
MKLLSRIGMFLLIGLITFGICIPPALAGAEHSEWPFVTEDYNDCTDEDVVWVANVHQTVNMVETPSGQVFFREHWRFEGTVEGLTTGYLWSTKGMVSITDRLSLNNNLTGSFAVIENALMRPLTPDAPTIRLDVNMKFAFNAIGEQVVERVNYVYTCLNQK